MSRHAKRNTLSENEVKRIVYDASQLDSSITAPLLATGGEHYRALSDLGDVLTRTVETITGKSSPPWALRGSGHSGFLDAPEKD